MPVIKKNTSAAPRSVVSAAEVLGREVGAGPAFAREAPQRVEMSPEEGTRRVVRSRRAQVVHSFELGLPDLHAPAPASNTRPDGETRSKKSSVPDGSVDALLAARDREWEQRLQRAVEAARTEGYARGYEESTTQQQADFEARQSTLMGDVRLLRTRWDDFLARMEPLLANLSFEIAQAVLDAPLPPKVKSVSTRAITEAVEQMASSTPIEILIHPVDFLRLQESGVVDQLESLHTGLRWEPRPELKHGDWIVQSPSMAVRRLEDELLTTLKSRLGLLAVAEKEQTHKAETPAQPE